jgi:hypothetical protein
LQDEPHYTSRRFPLSGDEAHAEGERCPHPHQELHENCKGPALSGVTCPARLPHRGIRAEVWIRALAVMAPQRVPVLQAVPTTAEAGMPELVVSTWYGMFAPANVRPEVVERMNGELTKILRSPDVVSLLNKVELDPSPSTPAEFAQFVRAEHDRWARVIKAANIKGE